MIDPCKRGGKANHERKATKKAIQAKWKVRPYLLSGFNRDVVLDLWLTGLTSALRRPWMKEYWDGAEYVAILRWLTDQGERI